MPTSALGQAQAIGICYAQPWLVNGIVADAPDHAIGTFIALASGASTAIDSIKTILGTGGWLYDGDIKASTTIVFPFGLPTLSNPPGFDSHNILYVTGTGVVTPGWIRLYDPITEHITADPTIAAWIPVGSTEYITALNIESVLSGYGVSVSFTIDMLGVCVFTITALAAGTLGNGISFVGSGSFSLGGTTTGGGWLMKSRKQVPNSDYVGNQLDMGMQIDNAGAGGAIQLTMRIAGSTLTWPLAQKFFTIIVDDYQARFYGSGPELATGDAYAGSINFWCCTPLTDQVLVQEAAFVITGSPVITIGVGTTGAIRMIVNGSVYDGTYGQTQWTLMIFHYSGLPVLLDPVGHEILSAPYVQLNDGTKYRVIGYISSCFVSSYPHDMMDQALKDQLIYRVIATQTGEHGGSTAGSAYMRTGETRSGSTDGTPSQTFSGTGLFVAGVYTRFNWLTGDLFDSSWVGYNININNVIYKVDSILSSMSLVFSPPVTEGSFVGTAVPFHILIN